MPHIQYLCLTVQPAAAAGGETAASAASQVDKGDAAPQAQPTSQQQTTPPPVVSSTSQQAAQTPSSPAPPQRPVRRKQTNQAQQPDAQPSPSKPAPVQQEIVQPSAAQTQPASSEINQISCQPVRVPTHRSAVELPIVFFVLFIFCILPGSASCYIFLIRLHLRRQRHLKNEVNRVKRYFRSTTPHSRCKETMEVLLSVSKFLIFVLCIQTYVRKVVWSLKI